MISAGGGKDASNDAKAGGLLSIECLPSLFPRKLGMAVGVRANAGSELGNEGRGPGSEGSDRGSEVMDR